MRRGWVLVVTPEWKGMVEFDARGRINKADKPLAWALRRDKDQLKVYLANKNKLLNWEEYLYGR